MSEREDSESMELRPVTEVKLNGEYDAEFVRVSVVLALERTRVEIGAGLIGLLQEGCLSLAVVWEEMRAFDGIPEGVLRKHLDEVALDITTTLMDYDRAWAEPADEFWFTEGGGFSWEAVPRNWGGYRSPALKLVE